MPWPFSRSSIHYLLVACVAFMLWGLLYFTIFARYDHFSDFGDVENFSLSPDPMLGPGQLSNTVDLHSTVNQLGHSGFFWSEAAFHYRTTLMHAVDWYQDPDVLHQDRWQQYPHGIDAWQQYSLLMEPVLGTLYRWFGGNTQNLIQFLMFVLPLLHVLLLFPVFHLAKSLSGDLRFSLISVAVFATCSLAFSPLISSFYVKETFSWPLFAVFLLGHFGYVRSGKKWWLALGAGALFVFLISWHLAQFLTIPVMIVGALCLVGHHKDDVTGGTIVQPLMYWVVFLLAGFVPWLWERNFIFSAPALLPLLWLALALVLKYRSPRPSSRKLPLLLLLLISILLLVVAATGSRLEGDYAHVGGLLWSRIAHGFQKPMDPGELPFAVRVFWVVPFSSPRWLALKAGLGVNGVLLVLATMWTFFRSFRREISTFEKSFIWCTVLYLMAFMFVERLAPLFILFAAVAISLFGRQLEKQMDGRAVRAVILPVFLILPVFNLFYTMGGMIQISRAAISGENTGHSQWDKQWDSARAQMFDWIRENTSGPGSVDPGSTASFVGEIGVSTQLLLYTGRPIVLNSQFENQEIRSRYSEYLTALYSKNEDDLFNFSKKYQVDYVFINRDWATASGRNTPRYLAGKTGQTSLETNISRLHFFPLSLPHFEPVYENSFYRVFAFRDRDVNSPSAQWNRLYDKWWNLENFSSDGTTLLNSVEDRRALNDLDQLFLSLPQKLNKVAAALEQGRRKNNPQVAPRENLSHLQQKLARHRVELLTGGNSETEIRTVRNLESMVQSRLSEVNPASGKTLQDELLGILNGSPGTGEGVLKMIVPFECSPTEYSIVAQLLVLLGEFEVAGEFYGKGGSAFPKPASTRDSTGVRPTAVQEQLWEQTVLYLMAGGAVNKGRNLARFCATHVSPGSPRQAFFIQAGNIKKQE